MQIYVNDSIEGWLAPAGQSIQFGITPLLPGQYIRLLAVDTASAEAGDNFFSTAWPNDLGNRITVKTPTQPGWLPDELWRVYVDDVQKHERLIWLDPSGPSGRMGGRGTDRGIHRGIGGYGVGRGNWRGLQRGYEPVTLLFETEVLAPAATYEIATTTLDVAENETVQTEENRSHSTWPDEPEDLLVASFGQGTGLTTLTWTESTDI